MNLGFMLKLYLYVLFQFSPCNAHLTHKETEVRNFCLLSGSHSGAEREKACPAPLCGCLLCAKMLDCALWSRCFIVEFYIFTTHSAGKREPTVLEKGTALRTKPSHMLVAHLCEMYPREQWTQWTLPGVMSSLHLEGTEMQPLLDVITPVPRLLGVLALFIPVSIPGT